ncbi:MAG: acyl--CoA ligase [Verrucomicrobiaceae bacterium]|nr:acyl--CoA ligase [Verrucomicrobiaceae bacterium]
MRGNVLSWIAERADQRAVALECAGRQLSYGELLEASRQLADQIRARCMDLREGVLRIGLHFPSGVDYVPLAMAVLQAGACFVPVPEELSCVEKQDLIQRTALDALITSDDPPGAHPISHGAVRAWLSVLKRGESALDEVAFTELNPAFIRFSSGTTGAAKGVVLSHESLRERIICANQALKIGEGDRILWVLPMAHHFAVSIVLYLYFGGTAILAEGAALGSDLLEMGRRTSPTVMYGSPLHYRQLVGACGGAKAGWSELRLAISTAAALDSATADAFCSAFGLPLTQAMGIIEAGLPLVNLDDAEGCPTAVGKPLPGWECRVSEESGELLFRGPGMFDAYLDPWTLRDEVLDSEGWFHTGDVAQMDEAGRVELVGRLKSMINVGGMKVFAEEIERVMEQHPSVARAMVTGRDHAVFGEIPIAKVMAKGDERESKDVLRWCRQRLAGWKVPAVIEWVDQLPTTASGKLKRAG